MKSLAVVLLVLGCANPRPVPPAPPRPPRPPVQPPVVPPPPVTPPPIANNTLAVYHSIQMGPTGWCDYDREPHCNHGPDSFAVTTIVRQRDTIGIFRRLP